MCTSWRGQELLCQSAVEDDDLPDHVRQALFLNDSVQAVTIHMDNGTRYEYQR